jgi:hypothetical protein
MKSKLQAMVGIGLRKLQLQYGTNTEPSAVATGLSLIRNALQLGSCGSAAAQCGKALPYRPPRPKKYFLRLSLRKRIGRTTRGKAEPFPTVRRQAAGSDRMVDRLQFLPSTL